MYTMSNPHVFDPTPVIFKRKKTYTSRPVSQDTIKQRKLENSDVTKQETIDKKTAQILQQGRCAKNISQKDLATRLQIQVKTIQLIEQGKAPKNRALWQKIARFLGVKI